MHKAVNSLIMRFVALASHRFSQIFAGWVFHMSYPEFNKLRNEKIATAPISSLLDDFDIKHNNSAIPYRWYLGWRIGPEELEQFQESLSAQPSEVLYLHPIFKHGSE